MNDRQRRLPAALGLLLLLGAVPGGPRAQASRETGIAAWPDSSRKLTMALVEKYGIPNRLNEVEAVWYDCGPWRRIVVHRDSWSRILGIREKNYLEQTIRYRVPYDKIASLKRFDKWIDFDEAGGELTSRAENESFNYMAFNLADEIVNGKRSVKEARDFSRRTEELAKAGKSSPYLEGFLFAREAGGGD